MTYSVASRASSPLLQTSSYDAAGENPRLRCGCDKLITEMIITLAVNAGDIFSFLATHNPLVLLAGGAKAAGNFMNYLKKLRARAKGEAPSYDWNKPQHTENAVVAVATTLAIISEKNDKDFNPWAAVATFAAGVTLGAFTEKILEPEFREAIIRRLKKLFPQADTLPETDLENISHSEASDTSEKLSVTKKLVIENLSDLTTNGLMAAVGALTYPPALFNLVFRSVSNVFSDLNTALKARENPEAPLTFNQNRLINNIVDVIAMATGLAGGHFTALTSPRKAGLFLSAGAVAGTAAATVMNQDLMKRFYQTLIRRGAQ